MKACLEMTEESAKSEMVLSEMNKDEITEISDRTKEINEDIKGIKEQM